MPRLISQRKPVKPPEKLTDDRWDYLALTQAQPNLGLAPTNNDGYTLQTDETGKQTFTNTLGKLEFDNSIITNTQQTDITIENLNNGNIVLSPDQKVWIKKDLLVEQNTEIDGQIVVKGDNPLGTFPVINYTLYVNENGDDANDGRAMDPSRAKRTISGAVRSPYYTEGTAIRVAAGHYWEDNPIPLKASTSVIGNDLRTTFIEPLNKEDDLFHVNSGVYIAQLAMLNLKKGSVERYAPGGGGKYITGAYATAFPPKLDDPILVQYSPYIQNCTNQSGPWLFDGTMFLPNQTVQVPLGSGISSFVVDTNTLTVAMATGSIAIGMSIDDEPNVGYENAYKLLKKNKPFLQSEIVAWVSATYPTFVYDRDFCYRDVGLIIDAVAGDSRFGGNLRAREAGLAYWNGNYSLIQNEQAQTIAAIGRLKQLAAKVVTNTVNTGLSQTTVSQVIDPLLPGGDIVSTRLTTALDIISNMISTGPSGLPDPIEPAYGLIFTSQLSPDQITRASTVTNITSTSTGLANAQTLLKLNKTFIQSEIVAWVDQTYPSLNYDKELCFRDVGLIVDAVSIDGIIGGNIQSRIAGLKYYTGNTSNIPNEIPQTVAAVDYINELAQQIIDNQTVTQLTTATQVIRPLLVDGIDASEGIAASIDIITNIIANGQLSAPDPVYPSLDQYVVTLDKKTVGPATSSTIYFGYTTVYPVEEKNIPEEWLSKRALNPQGSGGGALVDGNAPSANSPIQSFVFDAFTQLNQGGIGVHVINNGYAQLVSVFTIFCDVGVLTENGGICSITNSNANFGNYSLVSKGYGKLEFSGIIWNPKFPTNIPNGEYYPLGYWPQKGKCEVYIPDLVNRPHIALIMEIVPPKTYIDYNGDRVPYLNAQGYPGYLGAAINTSTVTAGAYSIDHIDTTGISVGHKLFIRDLSGDEGIDGVPYASEGTTVVDVGFQSVTLDKPLNLNAGDTTNDFYFNLFFCGNAYYTILSSEVDNTVTQKSTVSWVNEQENETSAAIRYARDVVNSVVSNIPVADPYQTSVTQAIELEYSGGQNAVGTLSDKFNIIADMIQFGQNAAPAIVKNSPLRTSNKDLLNAAKLIDDNKTFIQEEVTSFVDAELVGFTYNKEKCFRDTGLIVDSIAFDILYGGTSQSTFAGLQYWNQNGYTGKIPSEITTTTNTILYVQELAKKVVVNETTGTRYQNTITQVILTASTTASVLTIDEEFGVILNILSSGTAGVTDLIIPNGIASTATDVIRAYNLLQANKRYIQSEAIAYVNQTYPAEFVYNKTKCARDSGIIVDSIILDVLYPNDLNSQSTFAGLQYWNQDGYVGDIANELTTTTNAINYVSQLAQQIVQNITTGTRYQSTITQITGLVATANEATKIATDFSVITNILTGGTAGVSDLLVANNIEPSTDINTNRAYALLQENKDYISAEAVAWVEANKTAGFTYDKAKCGRDAGYMVDSIAFDLLHGGNRQAVQSGVYYYGFSNTSSAIPNESTQTVAAFNFIKSISRQIVQNNLVTPKQTVVPQVTNLSPSTDIQGAVFGTKIDVITRIITSGTSVANEPSPISLTRTTSTNALLAAKVLDANREFIQAEVIAYLDETFNFSYDPVLCFRDVGYMIDSVSFDLLHGGNRQAVHSGVYYYGFDSASSAVEGQRIETQYAYDHISDLTTKILNGDAVTTVYQTTITQVILPAASVSEIVAAEEKVNVITGIIANGPGVAGAKTPIGLTASSSTTVQNAFNAILANKEFIQAETIAYVDRSFSNFSYDQVKCARDTGIIIDSLATDLLFSGSSQSAFSGLQYWNQGDYTGSIAGELTTTTNAINYVKDLARHVILTSTTGTRYQSTVSQVTNLPAGNIAAADLVTADFDLIVDILNNGTDGVTDLIEANGNVSSDINVTRAYALLQANKNYLQHEAIAYVEATKTGGFEFDREKCARDLGYILEGVYYDVALGTTYHAVTSGQSYQRGIASSQAVLDKELTQTVAAINYAKSKTALLVGSDSTALTRSNNSFAKTIDIIQNGGTNTISFPTPTGGNINKSYARDQLLANKAFLKAELTAWINVQKANTISPFTALFSYDVAKCERDVGDIVDALCYDILYGGNSAINIAARAYFVGAVSVLPSDQRAPSAAAMARLSAVAQQVIQEQTVTKSVGNSATQDKSNSPATSTEAATLASLMSIITDSITNNSLGGIPQIVYPDISWATPGIKTAAANLNDNIDILTKHTVDYTRIQFSSFFTYNQDNCLRDTGLIIDSIAFDMLYNGTSQSTFAGLQYWNQSSYTGAIAQELSTTTSAISYVKSQIVPVVSTAGGAGLATDVANNFDRLLDILNNGTIGVTDSIVPNGAALTSTNVVSAYDAIQTVKDAVIDNTISWINTNNAGFSYDETLCRRDIGYILDSISFDLLHSGNRQSITSGVYYYGFNSSSTVLVNEIPQTTAAYNFIRDIVGKIVTGTVIDRPYQPYVKQVTSANTGTTAEATTLVNNIKVITDIINQGPDIAGAKTPIALSANTSTAVKNAFDLLLANRDFIVQETITYVNGEFIGPAYDRTKCRRDTGLIIDALAQDLLFDGSSQSNFAALQYWTQNGYTGSIDGEITTTTNAISYISDLAQKIVLGDTTGLRFPSGVLQKTDLPFATQAEANIIAEKFDLIIDIMTNGVENVTDRIIPNLLTPSSDVNIQRAYDILEANKVFLQSQAIAFVESTKSSGFSYDTDLCYRDVGYITDSVAFDLLYTGNRQCIQSAVYYYSFDSDNSAINDEIAQTNAAYEYIKTLAASVIKGDFIEKPYQSVVNQVLSNTVGTDAEILQISNNVDLITDIISNGPASALAKTPIGLTPSTDANVTASATLLMANKDFITAEVIAYINSKFGGFQYDKAKCFRDVGYMVDSVSFDLLHGGNRQAIQSGVYYYSFNGESTAIPNEIPQTTAAYTYLKTLVNNVLISNRITTVYQTGTTQVYNLSPATANEVTTVGANIDLITNIISTGPSAAPAKVPVGLVASNSTNVNRGYALLKANRQFIIDEVIAYINTTFVKFSYDRNKCYRDVNSILDAVIYDLLYPGNYRAVNTGNGYFSRKGRYHIINLEENPQDPLDFIDGSTVNFYQRSYQSASGYLFEYIGAGTNYSALPQIGRKDPQQSHETVQLNNGKVFFTSTDQNGDFRIGPGLVISQATGVLYGRTFEKSLYAQMTPFILVVGA